MDQPGLLFGTKHVHIQQCMQRGKWDGVLVRFREMDLLEHRELREWLSPVCPKAQRPEHEKCYTAENVLDTQLW